MAAFWWTNTMAAFWWTHLFSDSGCKCVFYAYSMVRGVSICTTCLFSIFQFITISPRNSPVGRLIKVKSSRYMGFSILLGWMLFMLINRVSPLYVMGKWSSKNITERFWILFCCTSGQKQNVTIYSIAIIPWYFISGIQFLSQQLHGSLHVQAQAANPTLSYG